MTAARQLRPALRGVRHATLIGLLAVTGMRPGEAVGLDRNDVDLNNGVVAIRAGKQKKQREVPLHATTIRGLRKIT
jgi:integrase